MQEIRDLSQEQNSRNPTTDAILRMCTRGQRFVVSEMLKFWSEPFLAEFTPTSAQVTGNSIPIPKDAFENRVLYVEFVTGGQAYRVPWRRFDQTASLRMSGVTVPVPYAAYIMGRSIMFAGQPSGQYTCRVVYLRGPEPLVLSRGRITAVGSGYLAIEPPDDDESGFSSENDNLASYFNVVDFQTGEVKGTFQIASLPAAGDRINVRSTPQRSSTQGRTIRGASYLLNPLTATGELDTDRVVAPDDYVCAIRGTCVPILGNALTSFIPKYVAAELSLSLDEALAQLSGQISEVYRDIAEKQDIGRGTPIRVKNTSKIWSRLNPIRFLPGSK